MSSTTTMSLSWRDLIALYRGRRILVTGHTGFKGGWLCSWLTEAGADVTGLALEPDTEPNLFTVLGLDERVRSHICDIRDLAAVRGVLAAVRPEIVFHLAAQPLVRRSYADPIGTIATNVLGTAHLLEAARTQDGVRAVVTVTTDKVYENREQGGAYQEADPLGGLDPYSASKAAAEIVTAAYQKNLCRDVIAIATARGGNVVGGGDWSQDRIVPDIVRAIATQTPIVLRYPGAIRPWQHVLELCEAYIELGARLFQSGNDYASAWNFGPDDGNPVNVGDLTRKFLQIWDREDHPIEIQGSPLYEAQTLRLDIGKAVSKLSWRPRLGVDETLAWTARWYKRFYEDPNSARTITLDQIGAFTALIEARRS